MSTTVNVRYKPRAPEISDNRSDRGSKASGRRVLLLAAGLAIAAVPLVAFSGSVREAAALHSLVSPGGSWLPAAALGPVLLGALELAGAIALLFTPGLLLALALGRARTVSEWVLHGFALSLLTVSLATAVMQSLIGQPLTGAAFILVVVCCGFAALAVVLARMRTRVLDWPLADRSEMVTLAGLYAVPLAMLVALAPKFFWEAFNGDGAHAYESARLLLHQPVPFWHPDAGVISGFPGTTSFLFAYPASWFLRLFGELEVSVRLPLLIFMPTLAAALFALIDYGRRRTHSIDRWLIWLALTVYVVVISFSATYSPYSADIALPATQDTLVVIAFLGFALAFLQRAHAWAAAWAFLSYVSLPNGLLLIAFLLAAWLLIQRPRPWRHVLMGGAMVAVAVAATAMLPIGLAAAGAPAPGSEYGAAGLLTRFAFLQVTDLTRLAYLAVPCGILPAFALLTWRRQDTISRAFTSVSIAYFLFAFVQAHAPLHYYIPAMVLPLIVYWRGVPDEIAVRTRWRVATSIAALVALYISWPSAPGPYTASRTVGGSIDIRLPGYATMDPASLRASSLLEHIIPLDWDPGVPHSTFGGSPIVFQYYAHAGTGVTPGNYVLQSESVSPPVDAAEVARGDGFALYVRDPEVWRAHLALRPATPAGARIYQQRRSILFRSVPHEGRPRIIDLPALAARAGVDVEGLARRLGVEP
jgi:hypothetical protein